MNSSLKLGQIGETSIRVHLTFFILLAWFGAIFWSQDGPAAAAHGLLLIILLFGCVVLHEFGHATAAKRYGIKTRDITLYPFGGVASLERMPEKPSREIVVALAGPAVNFVIAAFLMLVLGAQFKLVDVQTEAAAEASLVGQLATLNLVLAIFNLVPAFPMDGGRVLRAILGFRMSYVQATRTAARIGQVIAIAFVLLGLFGNVMLILIGIFVYWAAAAETYSVGLRETVRGHSVRDAMITRFESITPDARLSDAASLLIDTAQREFPVIDHNHQLKGLITQQAILGAVGESNNTHVRDIMQTNVTTSSLDSSLESIVYLLQGGKNVAVGIVDSQTRLMGYITPENLAELQLIDTGDGLSNSNSRPSAM